MNARERDWIMTRLKRSTHAALRELGDKWAKQYERGMRGPAPGEGGVFSLEQIIATLVERELNHRARSRKNSQLKTSKGRKKEFSEETVMPF